MKISFIWRFYPQPQFHTYSWRILQAIKKWCLLTYSTLDPPTFFSKNIHPFRSYKPSPIYFWTYTMYNCTYIQTDRQKYRWTGKQTQNQWNGQTNKPTQKQTNGQTNWLTDKTDDSHGLAQLYSTHANSYYSPYFQAELEKLRNAKELLQPLASSGHDATPSAPAPNRNDCPICFEPPAREVWECINCSNWLCGDCKVKIDICPSCRVSFQTRPPKRNTPLERLFCTQC